MPDQREIVMYWQPFCVYCIDLRWRMRRAKLPYTRIDIKKDREAAAFVRTVADGNEVTPTVTVGGHAMVNPSIRQVLAAVEEHAPHLLAP